uniref:Uncharacterized protein n=1 Tax=Anguilla anguilla TaxID=7936 RepID=A0A0E9WPL3_ANGAN
MFYQEEPQESTSFAKRHMQRSPQAVVSVIHRLFL